MNIFKATVASQAQAQIIREFATANSQLKEAYAGMVRSSEQALEMMGKGFQPYTIGGNQLERLAAAQAKYETLATLLATTGLRKEQIAELAQADAVLVEAADAE